MGFRFRRTFKILPGVTFVFGMRSVGLNVGTLGVHVSINSKGKITRSIGIPGTGLSDVEITDLNEKKEQ